MMNLGNQQERQISCQQCRFWDCSITTMGYCDIHQCFEEKDHSCKQAQKADELVLSMRDARQ